MNEFDKVIGYDAIKNELLQICDMVRNHEIYEKMGARLPNGVLMYGDPGLGKTLMAKSFISESGMKAYTVRKSKGSEDFIGEIADTFAKAKKNAPAIILFDDMDKFANEDDNHKDTEEYVAVQSGIDEVKDCGVFVLATANDIRKLPDSLLRAGRFDKKISVKHPNDNDAYRIIEHYLASKKVSEEVSVEDLTKMMSYSSCADLEAILNEAAISAAYSRKKCVEMEDIVEASLRIVYDSPDNLTSKSEADLKIMALHEAGHLVASEILLSGSVGLASIRQKGRNETGGFTHLCRNHPNTEDAIIISLAGKTAVEMYYPGEAADGCAADMKKAIGIIREGIEKKGSLGLSLMELDLYSCNSEIQNMRIESAICSELERYTYKTKDIIMNNKELLDMITKALLDKKTLLYSDIQRIRSETEQHNRKSALC